MSVKKEGSQEEHKQTNLKCMLKYAQKIVGEL